MRARAVVCLAFAGAALVGGPVSCAGLVGADFDAPHLGALGDGSIQPAPDTGPPVSPGHDGGGHDATVPVIPAEGGTCPTGLTNCSSLCVDTLNDPDHCGKCGTSCPGDPHGAAVCVKSHCTFACDQGWAECAGGCCDTSTDAASAVDTAVPPVEPPDGGPPPSPGIACGAARCPVASNSFCCIGGAGGAADRCDTNLTDTCAVEIFCDNGAQCGGGGSGVCCYDPSAQAICNTSCSSAQTQLCDPSAAGECGAGKACTGTFTAPGATTTYTSCQ